MGLVSPRFFADVLRRICRLTIDETRAVVKVSGKDEQGFVDYEGFLDFLKGLHPDDPESLVWKREFKHRERLKKGAEQRREEEKLLGSGEAGSFEAKAVPKRDGKELGGKRRPAGIWKESLPLVYHDVRPRYMVCSVETATNGATAIRAICPKESILLSLQIEGRLLEATAMLSGAELLRDAEVCGRILEAAYSADRQKRAGEEGREHRRKITIDRKRSTPPPGSMVTEHTNARFAASVS
jgi:hypothetical protein